MELVKSGIPGFDAALGGGIPFGSVVIIGGETGTGKTTLATQFLYMGAKQFDEPGLYLSFDERKSSFFAHMRNFGWDLAQLEREKKFLFIEFPPYEVEKFITQEEVVHEFIDDLGIERLVIDPITPFALISERERERRESMQRLFDKFRKWMVTSFVIGEGVQKHNEFPRTKFEADKLADGFVFIHSVVRGMERKKVLEILEMRGMKHSHKFFDFELGEDGVRIKPLSPSSEDHSHSHSRP